MCRAPASWSARRLPVHSSPCALPVCPLPVCRPHTHVAGQDLVLIPGLGGGLCWVVPGGLISQLQSGVKQGSLRSHQSAAEEASSVSCRGGLISQLQSGGMQGGRRAGGRAQEGQARSNHAYYWHVGSAESSSVLAATALITPHPHPPPAAHLALPVLVSGRLLLLAAGGLKLGAGTGQGVGISHALLDCLGGPAAGGRACPARSGGGWEMGRGAVVQPGHLKCCRCMVPCWQCRRGRAGQTAWCSRLGSLLQLAARDVHSVRHGGGHPLHLLPAALAPVGRHVLHLQAAGSGGGSGVAEQWTPCKPPCSSWNLHGHTRSTWTSCALAGPSRVRRNPGAWRPGSQGAATRSHP